VDGMLLARTDPGDDALEAYFEVVPRKTEGTVTARSEGRLLVLCHVGALEADVHEECGTWGAGVEFHPASLNEGDAEKPSATPLSPWGLRH